MHLYRRPASWLLAVLAVTALVAGACGDDKDDESKDKTTTTEESGDGSSTTVSPEDFDKALKQAEADLEAADGDQCKVFETLGTLGELPSPSDKDQTEQFIRFVRDAYIAIADTAPADQEPEADIIRTAGDGLVEEAEAQEFDPAFLTSDQPPAALTEEFNTAMQEVGTLAQQTCTPATDGEAPPTTTG